MEISENYRPHFSGFHDLMNFRVREILLVSSPYDAFVLEEDGRLSEKIFSEYLDMNLQFVPRIQRVSTAEEAFAALQKRTYDLIITMTWISDMNPLEFGKKVKDAYPGKPVVMLTYDTISEELIKQIRETKTIDKVFYWSGNNKILLAIIKYVEDLGNVEADAEQGVQVILVVEDSPWHYSQFLPIIYTEIMNQTRYLISRAVNDLHRLLRMRARPKILLAETYEEAIDLIRRYRHNLLGIISDVGFPNEGCAFLKGGANQEAGFDLARKIKTEIPDLPFLLQSEEQENENKASQNGINFLNKNSPNLLLEIRNFILSNYGFGDFVFRYPDGRKITEAANMTDFADMIHNLPEESLFYHASHNHFSRWFKARTEFELAEALLQKNFSEFKDSHELKDFIIDCIQKHFRRVQGGAITDFSLARIDMEHSFAKLGSGSLGGKGRGIAFFNSLLSKTEMFKKYHNVKIKVPHSFVICSEVFEEFLESNDLQQLAIKTTNEEEIAALFLTQPLPPKITSDLYTFIEKVNYPLAARSSSILEDSQMLPFAGLYSTYVLPNNHPDPQIRFKQLLDAVRLVYASVFYQSPKQYVKNTDLRIEEEKMAVLIQQLIGESHGDIFYPTISGVAQSYNFYPISYLKPEQGIVSLALGFGKTIVEGEKVYRFSPAYPKMNPPFSSPVEFLKESQTKFYALNLKDSSIQLTVDDGCTYEEFDLGRAEKDGALTLVASTYSHNDDLIRDTLSFPGPRVITFAPILKYELLPLANLIDDFFTLGKQAFSTHVEIEFAINIPKDKEKEVEFYFLQIRPMVVGRELLEVKIDAHTRNEIFCKSYFTMGNGIFQDIYDLIYIDPDSFTVSKTKKIAQEIGELNQQLNNENRRCVMLGFGRFGTSDPWLGIPLEWSQMSQSKVVIEASSDKLCVEPSLGSHFFHNLTSLKMGYFHINHPARAHSNRNENTDRSQSGDVEFIDWEWLRKIPVFRQTELVKQVRFDKPLVVKIDGRNGNGVILKPC